MINLNKFRISDSDYFELRTDDLTLDQVYDCYLVDIWFVGNNGIEIRFGYEHAGEFCYTLQQKIPRLLKQQCVIDVVVSRDLGFLMNQDFQGLYDQEYGFDEYYFLGNSHSRRRPYYSSWLYNDDQGNIVFEICPKYPWNDEDEKDCKHPDFISYDLFMKNYKPTVVCKIEPKYLQQWLEQVNILAPIFEKNEQDDLSKTCGEA